MPEQRTAEAHVEQAKREQPEQRTAEPEAKAAPESKASPESKPSSTRELRDAQSRPPIRAEGAPATGKSPKATPLFDENAGRDLRDRWRVIQTEFVDEPRGAVEKADSLVAEVLKRLTDTFARERDELEAGWSHAGDGQDAEVSTEDLRQAIRRYRSFFDRLLSI
jgi:hypothetical protein